MIIQAPCTRDTNLHFDFILNFPLSHERASNGANTCPETRWCKKTFSTHRLISSLIRRWFSVASSVSYSAVKVLSSKRKDFFFASMVETPEGSFMIGILGRFPKVISAAMPDDFLLIPAVSICDVIAARVRGSPCVFSARLRIYFCNEAGG